MALMVATRLWLGGVISAKRDKPLIAELMGKVRGMALYRPLLIAVDGFSSYVSTTRDAFRSKVPRWGVGGRCRLRAWDDIAIVQVVKGGAAAFIERRIVQGNPARVAELIATSQGAGGINTAYIERLNATFRSCLCWLTRRTRSLAHQHQTLWAGMYVVGCLYNLCDYHASLRVELHMVRGKRRWLQRTPAIAAGLTDHPWSPLELFAYKVPPPRWLPPKQRGRRSKQMRQTIQKWAA